VDSLLTNDPAGLCDPLGFPYMYTWELRTIDITQTPKHVVILSFFYGNYRVIWTDGRQPPKDADPRYNGYSVGKWTDDYTFVVTTTGMLPKTWLDHAGRPAQRSAGGRGDVPSHLKGHPRTDGKNHRPGDVPPNLARPEQGGHALVA
jgi:hypothetical protein